VFGPDVGIAGGMISGERNFGTALGLSVPPVIGAAIDTGMPKLL
jgi:hypothetical protein